MSKQLAQLQSGLYKTLPQAWGMFLRFARNFSKLQARLAGKNFIAVIQLLGL